MKIYLYVFFIFILFGCAEKKIEIKSPLKLKKLLKIKMVKIESGTFIMGSKNDRFGDKKLHTVRLHNFWIDETEVTNFSYSGGKKSIDSDLPVVNVTYYDAKKFCESLNKRLPTEAEWEYVARGGLKNRLYHWGDEKNDNLFNGRKMGKKGNLMVVKSFKANSYGVYDMSGNAREWVADSYEKFYYNSSPIENPLNKNETKYKVTRGGSFKFSDGFSSTVSFRSFDNPNNQFNDLGFRCAKSSKVLK